MVCLTRLRKFVPTRRIGWVVTLLFLGILNGCADEADEGRKLCKRFGPLCREAGEGKEGEIYLSVYASEGVSEVDLSGVGGPNPASSDGSRHRIQPGNVTLYWTSAGTRYFLEISVHANPGEPGKYALLLPPPGKGAQGKTRIYKLFLSGSYYAFVNPDE